MINTKYKLVRSGFMPIHRDGRIKYFYRVQAIRDIPEHNVKSGDFGGYVTSKRILSQEGSCWIGGEAQAIGNVNISDNAYVGGGAVIHAVPAGIIMKIFHSAITIGENARVTEKATVFSEITKDDDRYDYMKVIQGNAKIYGNAYIDTVRKIEGDAKIYGNAKLTRLYWVEDSVEIYDNAEIGADCIITGDSKIFGNVKLHNNVKVHDSWISGEAVILEGKRVAYGELDEGTLEVAKPYIESSWEDDEEDETETVSPRDSVADMEPTPDKSKKLWDDYQDIVKDIDSYRSDIVKIIKYPVMTDRTDQYTLKMMMALKKTQRLENSPESSDFRDAVITLEEAFMMAESNAEKIASSMLSDEAKKKTEKAKDLFRIAENEASSNNEKKVAFVQGFKQLEGIIAVPEIAVETFRVKVGLKELES